ncbi:MAG: hypothetical protein ACE5GF_09710, partial [Thermodesulfobacteriota bacterium]
MKQVKEIISLLKFKTFVPLLFTLRSNRCLLHFHGKSTKKAHPSLGPVGLKPVILELLSFESPPQPHKPHKTAAEKKK